MRAAIHVVLRVRYLMLLIFFAGLAITAYMYKHVPTAFVPQEDQGYFIIQVQAPQGASVSYTGRHVDAAQAVLRDQHDVVRFFRNNRVQFLRQRAKLRHHLCESEA